MRSTADGLFARYVTLTGAEAFSKLCVVGAFAYLARVLGPSALGLVELALSVNVFTTLFVENGLGAYGARVVAATPEAAPALVARIMILRAVLASLTYAVVLTLALAASSAAASLVAVYALTVFAAPIFVQWVFQGVGRMRLVAAGTVIRNVVFAGLVLAWLRPGADPRWVAAAEIAGVTALGAFNLVVLRWVLAFRPDWRGAVRGAARLLRETWPLAASEATWALLWYSPTLILGLWASTREVAWLAGPLRVVIALHTFVWLYFFNLLPNLSRAYSDSVGAWRRLAGRSLEASFWPACLVALGVTLAAPVVVTVLYGAQYAPAAVPLRIAVWMIPVSLLNGHFRYSLIASGRQRAEFRAAAATAAVTLASGLVLIPLAGPAGGATALLAGGLTNALLAGLAVRRQIGTFDVTRRIRSATAGVAGCLVLGAGAVWLVGPLAGGAVGCLGYLAILTTEERWLRMRQAWQDR